MGIYWKAVNLDKMESIDPAAHGGWGNKGGSLVFPGHPMGALLVEALMRRWSGDRIVMAADEADMGEPGQYYDRNLKDVTLEVLRSLRAWRRESQEQGYWSDAAWRAAGPGKDGAGT